ncbi:MAG: hypothetical protein M1826_001324 [Phylliscum demangeonii]|nr:MAG: hypothetical protein M1826_001324 [Phylliscum demangeonii]
MTPSGTPPPGPGTAPPPMHEKGDYYAAPAPTLLPAPPPAYMPPAPARPLSWASALYAYPAADAGDLALLPGDRIAVLEYINPEWWRGRNERTGQEGIFPRNYVHVQAPPMSVAGPVAGTAPVMAPSGYGNMPLDVAQGPPPPSSGPAAVGPSKFEAHGKRFGKKLGNAAIFGAGATIGGNLVNSIF